MAVQLIINADDFGATSAVNAAVLQAHRGGLLTSASLMVTGDAVSEAACIARDNPGLGVGLHLALSDSWSLLGVKSIPALVDRDSRFRSNPAHAALVYYVDPRARGQLRMEIEAQFEAFEETGLELSHVDGHQHLHAHPAVLPHVIELAGKYGARGVRVPGEPLAANLRADSSRLCSKLMVAGGHAYLNRVCRRLIDGSGLVSCDVCIGSLMSGAMRDDYVIEMLRRVGVPRVEVFFHPSMEPSNIAFGSNPGDLRALLSPELREFITGGEYELTDYMMLRREVRDDC